MLSLENSHVHIEAGVSVTTYSIGRTYSRVHHDQGRMYSRVRVGRTLGTSYPDVAYSRVRPTWVWRTLEYATSKEECTLESKSCLESVAAPTPGIRTLRTGRYSEIFPGLSPRTFHPR